jgi:hypothetical protein
MNGENQKCSPIESLIGLAELSVTIEKAISLFLVSVSDLGELPLIVKANVNCQHVT